MSALSSFSSVDTLRTQWEALDQVHGFSFKPDIQAYIESPILVGMLDEQKYKNKAQIEQFLNPPSFVKEILKALFVGSLSLRLGEYEIFVLSHRKSKGQRKTKFVLLFPQTYPHAFRIQAKDILDRFWYFFFKNPYPFDHPILDHDLIFKRDQKIHQALMVTGQDFWGDLRTHPAKLNAFAKIYESIGADFRINEESLCITLHQSVPTADELLKWKLFFADQFIPFLKHTSNNFAL
jgi:hypothetical protein